MGADALEQLKQWLVDEIEDRELLVATLKGGSAEAALLEEKTSALAFYKSAQAALNKSREDFESFLAAPDPSGRAASLQKVWKSF